MGIKKTFLGPYAGVGCFWLKFFFLEGRVLQNIFFIESKFFFVDSYSAYKKTWK